MRNKYRISEIIRKFYIRAGIRTGLLDALVDMTEYVEMFTKQLIKKEQAVNTHFNQMTLNSRDELERLSMSLDYMTDQIIAQIQELERNAFEKEKQKTELMVAQEIRAGMMPVHFPAYPERTEFDVRAGIAMSEGIGGDFYDFFPVRGNCLCLMAGRVAGKGIPASLYMVKAKTLMEHYIRQEWTPEQVLEEVNNRMAGSSAAGYYMTGFAGVLYLDSGLFRYADAEGGTFWRISEEQEVHKVEQETGLILGGLADVRYKQQSIQLKKGEQLVFSTNTALEDVTEEQVEQSDVWMVLKYF